MPAVEEFSNQVRGIVDRYLTHFPTEKQKLSRLIDLLNMPNLDVRSRQTLPGHLTASAFVVDTTTKRLLLIHHRKLNMWLQPGGHLEPVETLQQAAKRELTEEAGSHPCERHRWHNDPLLPIDIDIHLIPAHPIRNEPQHFHHDFRFLFVVNGHDWVDMNEEEAAAYRWVPLEDVKKVTADLERAAEKLKSAVVGIKRSHRRRES